MEGLGRREGRNVVLAEGRGGVLEEGMTGETSEKKRIERF